MVTTPAHKQAARTSACRSAPGASCALVWRGPPLLCIIPLIILQLIDIHGRDCSCSLCNEWVDELKHEECLMRTQMDCAAPI